MKLIIGIVMSGFLGLFSSSKNISFGAVRTVDLGVAKLRFALQEDFSKDMPAEPLIEKVDVRQNEMLEKLDNGLILQRWWDIKKPGVFSRNVGVLVMSIGVHPTPENTKQFVHSNRYNILERLDLVLSLNDRFHQMYDKHNEDMFASGNEDLAYYGGLLFSPISGDYSSAFRDNIINRTKWTSYSTSGQRGDLIVAHALPISRDALLELRFTYSPDQSQISAPEFDELVKDTRVTPTFNQFHIEFTEEASDVKALVQGKWLTETNDDVMESHIELLREKFPSGEDVKYIPPPEDYDKLDFDSADSSDEAWEPIDKS